MSDNHTYTSSSPVIRVADPSIVVAAGIHGLLVALLELVFLLVKLASTGSIKTAPSTNIAILVRWPCRKLVPLDTCKRGVLGQESCRQELLRCLHAARLSKRVKARLARYHVAKVLRVHRCKHAIAIVHLLVLPIPFALFACLLLQQGPNAYTASFRSEVAAQSVSAGKAPPTTPAAAILEIAATHKLFLARVQPLVSLAVVLTGKGFAANTADKGTLVRVRAQMRPEVVCSSKALRTQRALKRGGVLLRALRIRAVGRCGPRGVGQIQDVVAIGHA